MNRVYFVFAAILFASISWACCSVGMGSSKVHFAGQKNIIVWDPATKTEHFIRQAFFETDSASLGFIAPTPSIPNLEEVDPEAFKTLDKTDPPKEKKTAGGSALRMIPTVVKEMDIAGYHIATLRASDASGLAKWMKEHGYSTSKLIEAWTEFYIKKNWFLTCFKVNSESKQATTGLVKMSFTTVRPFNPYFVPVDNISPDKYRNQLGLYFVGPGVYSPEKTGTKHSIHERWRARLNEGTIEELISQLKLASLPEQASITAYEDFTFPNSDATDDIYFVRTGDAPPFIPKDSKAWMFATIGILVGITAWAIMKKRYAKL